MNWKSSSEPPWLSLHSPQIHLVSTCSPSFFIGYKSRRLGAFTMPQASSPTPTLLLGPLVGSVFLSEVSCDVVKRLGWLSLPRTWSSRSFWSFQSAQHPAQVHKLPSAWQQLPLSFLVSHLGLPGQKGRELVMLEDCHKWTVVRSICEEHPRVRLVQGSWNECSPALDPCSLLLLSRWRLFLTQPGQSQCPDHWFGAVLWLWTGDLRWGIWCRLHSHPVTVVFKTSLGPTRRNICYPKHLVFTHIITHTTEAKTLYIYSYIYKVYCIKLKKKTALWLQIDFMPLSWIARLPIIKHEARWTVVLAPW